MRFPVEGGCFCGAVRYAIKAEPKACGICHCRSCQRVAGAESVGWAVNEVENFEFIRGAPQRFESSPGVERTFCDRCGSGLTYQLKPDFIDVTLATLDDPEVLAPKSEVWCEARISWNALNDELDHYAQSSSTPQATS